MRRELDRVAKDGRVTLEVSNSSGKFWEHLRTKGVNQTNYKSRPREVGVALIELVGEWHAQVSISRGGNVDLTGSSYLALSWNRDGWYQLHQFPIKLPDPRHLKWSFPKWEHRGVERVARHLRGEDEEGTLFEWYGESGGQLKYYPLAKKAIWSSARFQLEPLGNAEHGILAKVAAYFPQLWADVNQNRRERT
jgi:hypothetical protein